MLHSRVAKVLSFAPLTFLLFVISPWALYFSGWYDASLRSVLRARGACTCTSSSSGSLFFWPLVGIDPVPGRVAYPFRLLLIVLTLPFHAFLGVTIMGQEALIAGQLVPRAADGLAARTRQRTSTSPAGSCGPRATWSGWCSSAVLFTQWVRSSMREAVREDRRLDRLEAQAARARRVPVESPA